MSFGIRLMSLDRQERVIDDIRAALDPPPGVSAAVVGVPVLAADANAQLASEWRRLLMLVAGLAAVFVVLLALRRRAEHAVLEPRHPSDDLRTGHVGGVDGDVDVSRYAGRALELAQVA